MDQFSKPPSNSEALKQDQRQAQVVRARNGRFIEQDGTANTHSQGVALLDNQTASE